MRTYALASTVSLLSTIGTIGTIGFSALGPAMAGDEPRLWMPDPHVVCDREQVACFDSYGVSLGYTQIYFGDEAEASLLTNLTAEREPDTIVELAPGVSCSLTEQVCLDDNGVSIGLTAIYFGQSAADSLTDQVTRRIYKPLSNVACDMDQSICFDGFGYSLGYTEFYLGRAPVSAWLEKIRQGEEPVTEFSPAPDVVCDLVFQTCVTNDGVSMELTEEWFGEDAAAMLARHIYGDPSLEGVCRNALAAQYQVVPSGVTLQFARRDEGGNAYGFTLPNGRQGTCRVLDNGTVEYIVED